MKKVTVTLSCPKEAPSWTLSVVKDMPETSAEWLETLGEERLCSALEKFTVIRSQDTGRRLKAGGKNTAPQTDAVIRKAVEEFKVGERIRVQAVQRPPTPEEAKKGLMALGKDALLEAIKELQRAASGME